MRALLLFTLASLLGTGMASAAAPAGGVPEARASYYYWLQPKLGMVKVDRATNAILAGRASSRRTAADGQDAAR